VSFVAGLVWGIVIAAIEVALEHYGPAVGPFALNGNGALAVPAVLVPLAIYWGWTWASNRWSGRSLIPTIAFIAGLYLGVGLVVPADALLFPQGPDSTLASSIPGLLFTGALFVLPPAVVAAAIYWVLRSDRFPANAIVILLLYLIALAFAVVPGLGPLLTGGIVAGTAAGQSWRAGGGPRLSIGVLVIVLMLVAVFGIPYVLSNGLPRPT
jgi:hypothetical protein